jgi:hypothetical protein
MPFLKVCKNMFSFSMWPYEHIHSEVPLGTCIHYHDGINDIQHQENPVTFLNAAG